MAEQINRTEARFESHNNPSDQIDGEPGSASPENEEDLVIRYSLLVDAGASPDQTHAVRDAIANQQRRRPQTLEYHASNEFLSSSHKAVFEKAFPELFPFGVGGMDTKRRVPVSAENVVRVLL